MLNVGEFWKVVGFVPKRRGAYCWEIYWDRRNFSSHLNLVCGGAFGGGGFGMS